MLPAGPFTSFRAAETSIHSDAGDKKGKDARKGGAADKAGGKSKDGAPPPPAASPGAALLGHYAEPGLGRRLAAFRAWRAEDAEDLASRVAAAQAAWEAEKARLEAERARIAAENSTLKAKRRAAKAAAAAAAAGGQPGEGIATSPRPNGVTMDLDESASPDVSLRAGGPGGPADAPPPLVLPQHGGLVALCVDGGAAFSAVTNPTLETGPVVTLLPPPSQPPLTAGVPATVAAAVAAAAAQALGAVAGTPLLPLPPPLLALERQVEESVGVPHNFDGFPPPEPRQSSAEAAEVAEAEAAAAAAEAQRQAAEAEAAEALSRTAAAAAAGAEASYQQYLRGGRASAGRAWLMQRVMGVVTAALTEVAAATGGSDTARASGPAAGPKEALLHVAAALAAAAAAEEGGFTDPYLDPQYGIQLEKIEAKAARERARAEAAREKAER